MSYVLVLYPGISAQRWKKCKAANTNPFWWELPVAGPGLPCTSSLQGPFQNVFEISQVGAACCQEQFHLANLHGRDDWHCSLLSPLWTHHHQFWWSGVHVFMNLMKCAVKCTFSSNIQITNSNMHPCGWDTCFYLMGSTSLLWTLAWAFLAHDSPKLHPSITEEVMDNWTCPLQSVEKRWFAGARRIRGDPSWI